jgi:hypothetical protein
MMSDIRAFTMSISRSLNNLNTFSQCESVKCNILNMYNHLIERAAYKHVTCKYVYTLTAINAMSCTLLKVTITIVKV